MPNKRFALDFSGYDGSQVSVVKRTFTRNFPRSARQLSAKPLSLPGIDTLKEERVQRGLSKFFIQNKKTTTTEGTEFFRRFQEWILRTLLNNAKGLSDIDAENLLHRLSLDPIGTKTPDQSDAILWKAIPGTRVADTGTVSAAGTATGTALPAPRRSSRVAGAPTAATAARATVPATAAPLPVVNTIHYEATPLQVKYQHYQKELYVMFRVNIPAYIDNPGRSALASYVDTDNNHRIENDASLTDANFFDAKNCPKNRFKLER